MEQVPDGRWLCADNCRNILAEMHSGTQLRMARPHPPLSLSLIVVFLLCPHALPQTKSADIPASDSKLIEIKVAGSNRFQPEEVAAASGLQVGTTVDDEVFRKASRQLGESGAFDDVSYSFSYSSAGTKLSLRVKDTEKFVPAHFADFVWFSDNELLQKLHDRIPLFDGDLPTFGRLPDQVSDVLQALLVENNIPGQVQYLRSNDASGKLEAFDYTVANIVIRIHQVEFPGAGGDELRQLQAASEKLAGRDYYRALLHDFVEHSVLPVYHERGYLKVVCAPAQPKVVKPDPADASDKSEDTLVDVAIAVTPGSQYKLTGWDWSGNKNLPMDQLQALMHAKTGQPANLVQLEDDLHAVQQLYGAHGYVTTAIKANANFDDAAGTVSYQLAVNEGDLYRMGELEFRGLDNNLTARLRTAWKLRPGDVYDASYLKEFLPQARKLLPPTMDWDVASHVTAMAKDKTVDVDLQYTAKAPR
jgi:outer membrane protein assembly factor BamA